jgi:crossover junction endodeoxyribonuclease RuvC
MVASYLGIDPGKSGAVALLHSDGVEIQDWVDGPTMDGVLKNWQMLFGITMAALEHVSAMPKQGVTSMFSFGTNFGWWQGWLECAGISYVLVRPQNWQKGMVPKKMSNTDKPSLTVVRRLFPDVELHLQKHHGRADALLIADWLRRARK